MDVVHRHALEPFRVVAVGFDGEPFPDDPGYNESRRSCQEPGGAPRGKPGQVARPLPGPRGDLEKERSSRRDQRLGRRQDPFALRPREPDDVTEQGDLAKAPLAERGSCPVALHAVHRPERFRAVVALGRYLSEHLPRQVERDPSGAVRSQVGEEPTRSGADVQHPGHLDPMAQQEAYPKLPKQVPLARPLVPLPLAARPVGVDG